MKIRYFLALVMGVFLFTNAFAADGKGQIPWKTSDYTLLARQMPLRDLLTTFGTAEGVSVVLSKAVNGVVSGDFKKLPPQEFLERISMLHNLIWYYDGTSLFFYAGGEVETMLLDLQYMKAGEVQSMLKELGVEDERFPLKMTSHDELLLVAGPPRYVQLVAELVAKADKLLEKRSTSELETRVFYLKHTWADDVSFSASSPESGGQIKGVARMLEDILASNNSVMTREKGSSGEESQQDDLLQGIVDSKVKPVIKAENRLNAVIIRDVASRMPLYEQLIEQLDVPKRLVEIAVTTVEMSRNDALDWQLSLSVKGQKGDFQGSAGQNAENLFGIDDLTGKGLSGALSYISKHVAVSASLTALRQKGKARSISRTSILTVDNLAATFTDKQSYHARVVGTEVATLQEVSVGINLSIKPRIMETLPGRPSRFWMTIDMSDGGFEAVTVDSMPLTRTSTLTTQTAVNEGECLMLAGYIRDTEEKVGWGIPYLRDIPWIGWIFGGVTTKKEDVQRIFILTPYTVDLDTEDLARIQATRQRDIHFEEELEQDKEEDDALRDIRDMEREDRNQARKKKYADFRDRRKAEIELEKDKRNVRLKEKRQEWQEEVRDDRLEWEEEQRIKAEAERLAEKRLQEMERARRKAEKAQEAEKKTHYPSRK